MAEHVKHADDCKCRECKRRRNEPERETCDACGKKRLCQQVVRDSLRGAVTYDPHYCVAECLKLSDPERGKVREAARQERRRKRTSEPPLAWPIVGGPLDGKFAVPADFYDESLFSGREPGRYLDYSREYEEFNAATGGNRRIGGTPTMIFVHKSKLLPMIRGRDR